MLISGKKLIDISPEKIATEIKDLLISGERAKDITEKLSQKYHKYCSKSEIYKICNSLKIKK